MKKFFIVLECLFLISGLSFAQSLSAKNAAFRTAERCLKLSENYLLSGDVQSALSQAEIGISYDDSISDLFYIKAVCSKAMEKTVREVLELAEAAREKNNWIGYNEKGNRILLADLLSDTGCLEEALEEIDKTPFVFSADAEAIRVKTYYRLGTDDFIKKAREKTNSARRIYKGDSRFLYLFFYFEMARTLENGANYIPDLQALKMADVLSQEMKNYKDISEEIECISLFFTGFSDKEKQIRGLKAFEAAGKEAFLFPIAALQSGYWNEEKAFDEFCRFADDSCTIELFSYFLELIKNPEIVSKMYQYLNSWNGILYQDNNYDMQWETEIVYERGRPASIKFDGDNDGVTDLTGNMDFGELLSVKINPLDAEFFYSDFPYLGRAVVSCQLEDTGEKEYVVFDFSKESAVYSPLKFVTPFDEFFENEENHFFVPEIKNAMNGLKASAGFADPVNLVLLEKATFIRVPVPERENAYVTYSLLNGKVVSAVYSQNEKVYASAEFSSGVPVDRYADYDMDGIFETHEIFENFTETNISLWTEADKKQVKNLFPYFHFENDVYVASILIDADNNNFPEYREYFYEKGGKTSLWVRSDGHSESYSRFPCDEGEPLVEESVFVVGLNHDTISVMTVGGEPSSVKINEAPYKVYKGEMKDFYWIQRPTDSEQDMNNGAAEIELFEKFMDSSSELNGKLIVLNKEESDEFYRAIRVSGKIYAMKFSLSEELNTEELEKTE